MFMYMWGNNYLSFDCEVYELVKFIKGCLIGVGMMIGVGMLVLYSVIGKNVIIGQNCVILGVYIFDGVCIENEFSVTSVIL